MVPFLVGRARPTAAPLPILSGGFNATPDVGTNNRLRLDTPEAGDSLERFLLSSSTPLRERSGCYAFDNLEDDFNFLVQNDSTHDNAISRSKKASSCGGDFPVDAVITAFGSENTTTETAATDSAAPGVASGPCLKLAAAEASRTPTGQVAKSTSSAIARDVLQTKNQIADITLMFAQGACISSPDTAESTKGGGEEARNNGVGHVTPPKGSQVGVPVVAGDTEEKAEQSFPVTSPCGDLVAPLAPPASHIACSDSIEHGLKVDDRSKVDFDDAPLASIAATSCRMENVAVGDGDEKIKAHDVEILLIASESLSRRNPVIPTATAGSVAPGGEQERPRSILTKALAKTLRVQTRGPVQDAHVTASTATTAETGKSKQGQPSVTVAAPEEKEEKTFAAQSSVTVTAAGENNEVTPTQVRKLGDDRALLADYETSPRHHLETMENDTDTKH